MRYTWGLDIARSLTDAGRVGALVQITDAASQQRGLRRDGVYGFHQ
jgi:hypothetical protein